mmetsp:Transcript_11593/g.34703  ORF Transcript_11593/g.34703 Transcript_11593/m.34703 type:complete len:241 (+) Transcript_11593:230-952(+)
MVVRELGDAEGVFFVDGLSVEGVGVFGLAFGGLVEAEPVADEGYAAFGDVAEASPGRGGVVGVVGVDDEQLPVGLAAVHEGEGPENAHSLHCAADAGLLVELEHVHGIVVAAEARVRVFHVRVLPRLRDRAVVDERRTVLVGARRAVLEPVLDDGIERQALVDFHFLHGVARDFADERQERGAVGGGAGLKRQVVPGAHGLAVLLVRHHRLAPVLKGHRLHGKFLRRRRRRRQDGDQHGG